MRGVESLTATARNRSGREADQAGKVIEMAAAIAALGLAILLVALAAACLIGTVAVGALAAASVMLYWGERTGVLPLYMQKHWPGLYRATLVPTSDGELLPRDEALKHEAAIFQSGVPH